MLGRRQHLDSDSVYVIPPVTQAGHETSFPHGPDRAIACCAIGDATGTLPACMQCVMQAEETLASLPPSLQSLQLVLQTPIQVRSVCILPHADALQRHHQLQASGARCVRPHSSAHARCVDATLSTLYGKQQRCSANFAVRSRPDIPIPGIEESSSDAPIDFSQGSSFACLPLLRELRIEAETDQGDDMYDGTINADLTGLLAGLQTLTVAVSHRRNLHLMSGQRAVAPCRSLCMVCPSAC